MLWIFRFGWNTQKGQDENAPLPKIRVFVEIGGGWDIGNAML